MFEAKSASDIIMFILVRCDQCSCLDSLVDQYCLSGSSQIIPGSGIAFVRQSTWHQLLASFARSLFGFQDYRSIQHAFEHSGQDSLYCSMIIWCLPAATGQGKHGTEGQHRTESVAQQTRVPCGGGRARAERGCNASVCFLRAARAFCHSGGRGWHDENQGCSLLALSCNDSPLVLCVGPV